MLGCSDMGTRWVLSLLEAKHPNCLLDLKNIGTRLLHVRLHRSFDENNQFDNIMWSNHISRRTIEGWSQLGVVFEKFQKHIQSNIIVMEGPEVDVLLEHGFWESCVCGVGEYGRLRGKVRHPRIIHHQ